MSERARSAALPIPPAQPSRPDPQHRAERPVRAGQDHDRRDPRSLMRRALLRRGVDADVLLRRYWSFDAPQWQLRNRHHHEFGTDTDDVLAGWLAARLRRPVPIAVATEEFERLLADPAEAADRLLVEMAEVAALYRRLPDLDPADPYGRFHGRVVVALDTAVATPLLLWLPRSGVPIDEQHRVLDAVESWIMRRSVCRLGLDGGPALVCDLIGVLAEDRDHAAGDLAARFLLGQSSDVRSWPTDRLVEAALTSSPLRRRLADPVLVMLLGAIEERLRAEAAGLVPGPSDVRPERVAGAGTEEDVAESAPGRSTDARADAPGVAGGTHDAARRLTRLWLSAATRVDLVPDVGADGPPDGAADPADTAPTAPMEQPADGGEAAGEHVVPSVIGSEQEPSTLGAWVHVALPDDLRPAQLMPSRWEQHWPPAGTADLARRRPVLVESLGNLTLTVGAVDEALSTAPWDDAPARDAGLASGRRTRLVADGLVLSADLPASWDDIALIDRGQRLAEVVLRTWPHGGADAGRLSGDGGGDSVDVLEYLEAAGDVPQTFLTMPSTAPKGSKPPAPIRNAPAPRRAPPPPQRGHGR